MIGFLNGFIVTLFGVVYPAYKSFKAIESVAKDDDTQWLIYWVVFACFQLIESLTDFFVSWFPFYYELKLAALVALQWPEMGFAQLVYRKYVRRFLVEQEETIDKNIAEFKERGSEFVMEKSGEIAKVAAAGAAKAVEKSTELVTEAAKRAAEKQAEAAVAEATSQLDAEEAKDADAKKTE